MSRDPFDELWVWDDKALAASLAWYRAVAANRMPAKFVIAATIPAQSCNIVTDINFPAAFSDEFTAILEEYLAPGGGYAEMAGRWGFTEAEKPTKTMVELCGSGL